MSEFIYLDYQSTTPIASEVLDEMTPYLMSNFGNPASPHILGIMSNEAVERSRKRISRALHCLPSEIIFTSGASEANNLAIKGTAQATSKKHLITTMTEHACILRTCEFLEQHGYKVTYLSVDKHGAIDPIELEKSITTDTFLISVMYGNNETGYLQPVREISKIAQKHNILFHTDATQAFGYIDCDTESLGVDLLTCSSHKIYGPKGIGALVVKNKVAKKNRIKPILHGGGQERGMRSGTLNVPGIVGFGKAAELARSFYGPEGSRADSLRLHLLNKLASHNIEFNCNTNLEKSLPHCLSLTFPNTNNQTLLQSLSNYAISTGSACNTGNQKPSHVLTAMGLKKEEANCTIRISIGRFTTQEHIDAFFSSLRTALEKSAKTSVDFKYEREG